MPARRKVSLRQMELLVEFAESHRDIALGRFPGPQAVRITREVWNSLAVKLNSVAEETSKTPHQWRRYWIELKAKTKAKAADSRRNASARGGGRNKLVPLNVIEERVLAIMGPVREGLPGVRLPINDPLADIPMQSDDQSEVSSREDGPAQRTTPPVRSRRSRSQRQSRRDVRVPRWAYDIEMRRIAAEERHAAAMEAMVHLMKEIRNVIRGYLHRTD